MRARHFKPGLVIAFCCSVTTLLSLGYVAWFHAALANGDWQEVGGFTRLLIPDTYVYASLLDEDLGEIGFAVAGVKNALGPALLWLAAGSGWYLMAAINGLFVCMTLVYAARLCRHFGLDGRQTQRVLLIAGLAPVMAYYSVGALKELPTLAALTAFLYHWMRRETWRWLLMAAILVVFRYQLVAVLALFALVDRSKNPLRAAVIAVAVAAAAYPLFSDLAIVANETTELFREEAESGRGAVIEQVRSSVPILSAVAVAIRVLQSLLEPLATFLGSLSVFEAGALSVLAVAYLASLLLVLPSWWRVARRSRKLFKVKRTGVRDLARLYALIVVFVVPVAGFSFVHHRYLFPVTVLVLIAGVAAPRSRSAPLRLLAAAPGRAAPSRRRESTSSAQPAPHPSGLR